MYLDWSSYGHMLEGSVVCKVAFERYIFLLLRTVERERKNVEQWLRYVCPKLPTKTTCQIFGEVAIITFHLNFDMKFVTIHQC